MVARGAQGNHRGAISSWEGAHEPVTARRHGHSLSPPMCLSVPQAEETMSLGLHLARKPLMHRTPDEAVEGGVVRCGPRVGGKLLPQDVLRASGLCAQ